MPPPFLPKQWRWFSMWFSNIKGLPSFICLIIIIIVGCFFNVGLAAVQNSERSEKSKLWAVSETERLVGEQARKGQSDKGLCMHETGVPILSTTGLHKKKRSAGNLGEQQTIQPLDFVFSQLYWSTIYTEHIQSNVSSFIVLFNDHHCQVQEHLHYLQKFSPVLLQSLPQPLASYKQQSSKIFKNLESGEGKGNSENKRRT